MYFAVGRVDPEESRVEGSLPIVSELINPRSTAHRLNLKDLFGCHGLLELFNVQKLTLLHNNTE